MQASLWYQPKRCRLAKQGVREIITLFKRECLKVNCQGNEDEPLMLIP